MKLRDQLAEPGTVEVVEVGEVVEVVEVVELSELSLDYQLIMKALIISMMLLIY